jgi:hypothetical protein
MYECVFIMNATVFVYALECFAVAGIFLHAFGGFGEQWLDAKFPLYFILYFLYFVTFLSQVYLWNLGYSPWGEHGSDGVAPTQDKGGIGTFQPILTYPNPFPIPLTALK